MFSEPMVHSYAADMDCSSATSIMYEVKALKMYITEIPARIIVEGDAFFMTDSPRMTAEGIRENKNAFVTMPTLPTNPPTVIPMVMARVAPKEALDEMPVVYESASGFFSMLCIAAPVAASPAPDIIANRRRGRRCSQTTRMSTDVNPSDQWVRCSQIIE